MKKITFILISLLVIASMVLAGCQQVAEPIEEVGEEPEETTLGTEADPIQWVFVPSGEMEDVSAGADEVADLIFEETGLVVETFVATDYTAAIEALCSGQAQMGSLATFAAITAADRGCAYPELVAVRFGNPYYNGQLIVQADSGIEGWGDLAGTTFCATDETSTSGWIIPTIEMRAAGLDPAEDIEVVFAGSHDAAVLGVYNGDCDAGASYVDARTAIEDEFEDVNDVVEVAATTLEIPNDGVQFVSDFPECMKWQLMVAMQKIILTDEGGEAMDQAYEWDGLQVRDNTYYDPFRQLLDAAGISAEDF